MKILTTSEITRKCNNGLLASERSERDSVRSVKSRIAICVIVRTCMSLCPLTFSAGVLSDSYNV